MSPLASTSAWMPGWRGSCSDKPRSASPSSRLLTISRVWWVASWQRPAGKALAQAVTAVGSTEAPSAGVASTRSSSSPPLRSCAARRRIATRSRLSFSVSMKRRCASGVGTSLPRTRSNSCRPSCSSACCSTLVTAGWEMCSSCAAPLTEPACMMAWKTSMWRSLMNGEPPVFCGPYAPPLRGILPYAPPQGGCPGSGAALRRGGSPQSSGLRPCVGCHSLYTPSKFTAPLGAITKPFTSLRVPM
jgi:hypothetical protein